MSNDFRELVLEGRFEDAIEVARGMAFDPLADTLQGLAFDTESLTCYGFAAALASADETAEHHYLAAELLTASPLNQIPGAYHLAYYHGRRAVELAPNDLSYKEFLLFFHRHPDNVMAEGEANRIARDILAHDPANTAAKRVLGS